MVTKINPNPIREARLHRTCMTAAGLGACFHGSPGLAATELATPRAIGLDT